MQSRYSFLNFSQNTYVNGDKVAKFGICYRECLYSARCHMCPKFLMEGRRYQSVSDDEAAATKADASIRFTVIYKHLLLWTANNFTFWLCSKSYTQWGLVICILCALLSWNSPSLYICRKYEIMVTVNGKWLVPKVLSTKYFETKKDWEMNSIRFNWQPQQWCDRSEVPPAARGPRPFAGRRLPHGQPGPSAEWPGWI